MTTETRKSTQTVKTEYDYTYFGLATHPHYEYTSTYQLASSRTGETNPRYKWQIRNGLQAATGFTAYTETYSTCRPAYLSYVVDYVGPGTPLYYQINGGYVSGTRHIGTASNSSVLSEVKADNVAKQQLVSKIRSLQTTFQGGVFLGEGLETLRLLTNPARELRRRVDHYFDDVRQFKRRKKRKTTPKDVLDYGRDKWLNYQLGWAPLLSDIDNGAEALANSRYMKDQLWRPVRAIGKEEVVTPYLIDTDLHPGYSYNVRLDVYKKSIVTVRYIACVDVGSHNLSNMRRIGLDWSNAPLTAWELIPWSFVIDYFTNIGHIVSAASLAQSGVRWVVKTVRKENLIYTTNYQVFLPDSTYYKPKVTAFSPGKQVSSYKHVTREPYYGSLVPTLTFKVPGSGTQWLNLAALWSARRELQTFHR